MEISVRELLQVIRTLEAIATSPTATMAESTLVEQLARVQAERLRTLIPTEELNRPRVTINTLKAERLLAVTRKKRGPGRPKGSKNGNGKGTK